MAERRMISKRIVDTDIFLDMPISTRLLYYDLNIRADDDGFVSSPKKIVKMIGASCDDLKLLAAKQFIIPFDSGVCVIRDWKIHNFIRNDRYKETFYKSEKKLLYTKENKAYTLCKNESAQNVEEDRRHENSQLDTAEAFRDGTFGDYGEML